MRKNISHKVQKMKSNFNKKIYMLSEKKFEIKTKRISFIIDLIAKSLNFTFFVKKNNGIEVKQSYITTGVDFDGVMKQNPP